MARRALALTSLTPQHGGAGRPALHDTVGALSACGAPNTTASHTPGRLPPIESWQTLIACAMGCAAHPGSPLRDFTPPRAHSHRAFTTRLGWWLDRGSLSRLRGAGATRCLSVSTTYAFPEHTSHPPSTPSPLSLCNGLPHHRIQESGLWAVSSRERDHRPSFHSLGDGLAPWAALSPPRRPLVFGGSSPTCLTRAPPVTC